MPSAERTAAVANFYTMLPFKCRSSTALAAILAVLVLPGCGQNSVGAPAQPTVDTYLSPLPLTTSAATPSASAPASAALQTAPPAPMAYLNNADTQYAYEDRAYNLTRVLGDTPPDYSFDYDGTRPWTWRGDGFVRVVEPTPDGERYYYYDSRSSAPYLIQDGDYSYAYSGNSLVVVYGPGGQALAYSDAQARADLAGRYLARARAIYRASMQSQRQAVALDDWRQRQAGIVGQGARWDQQQESFPDWRAYHDSHQAEDDAYWQGERDRRDAEAQGYRQALAAPTGDGTPVALALVAAAAAYEGARAGPSQYTRQTDLTSGPAPMGAPPRAPDSGPPAIRAQGPSNTPAAGHAAAAPGTRAPRAPELKPALSPTVAALSAAASPPPDQTAKRVALPPGPTESAKAALVPAQRAEPNRHGSEGAKSIAEAPRRPVEQPQKPSLPGPPNSVRPLGPAPTTKAPAQVKATPRPKPPIGKDKGVRRHDDPAFKSPP